MVIPLEMTSNPIAAESRNLSGLARDNILLKSLGLFAFPFTVDLLLTIMYSRLLTKI